MGQVSQSIWAKMLNYIHPKETVTTFTDVGVRFKCDKLILVVKAKKKRLQDLVIKLEADLLKQVKKPTHNRCRIAQLESMQTILMQSEKLFAYEETIYSLNKIKDQAYVIVNNIADITPACFTAICSVLYIYDTMNLKQYISLNSLIPNPKPQIDISKISPKLQQYMNITKATDAKLNAYAQQFCKRNSLNLDILNQVGHKFTQQLQHHYALASEQLFALQLTDVDFPVDEQANHHPQPPH